MATKNVIGGSNKVSASQLKDFFRQIDEGGITGDHIQAILERKNPFSNNQEIQSISLNEKLYKVEIDGMKTSKQLIHEWDYGTEWSWEQLYSIPVLNKTKRIINIKLFDFDDSFSISKIINEIASKNFYPTTFDELLNLGIQHSQLCISYNIIAIGTVIHCDIGRVVPDWVDNIPTFIQGSKIIRLIKKNELNNRNFESGNIRFKFAGSRII